MMLIDAVAIAATLLGILPYLSTLYVARVILGLCAGLNSSIVRILLMIKVPQYNRQLTPMSLRGSVGVVYTIQLNIGILLALVLGL
jgi:MFS family permease